MLVTGAITMMASITNSITEIQGQILFLLLLVTSLVTLEPRNTRVQEAI